jgi:hypothetical protein
VHQQELAIDSIAFARAVDVHASLVQDRLTERELLARVASGLFRTPATVKANMLEPLRSAIYAFKTDFVLATWIARLKPNELAAAQSGLKSEGFSIPSFATMTTSRSTSRRSTSRSMSDGRRAAPADAVIFPGRLLDQHSIVGPTGRGPGRGANRLLPTLCRCCATTVRPASCSLRPCSMAQSRRAS